MSLPPSPSPSWREQLQLRRSTRARHLRMKIHPDRRVELVMPRGFDPRQLPAILDHYEPWVVRQLRRMDEAGVVAPVPAEPPQRIELAALGECWEVEYLAEDGGRHGCRSKGQDRLLVSGGHHWQQGLRRWLARKGRAELLPWLERVSQESGLPFSGATVRGQRTRWGSCSSRRHINLNFGLLFLRPELVHYLFIHELSHTRHMNHSPAFWRLVAQLEPDYRALDRELRHAGAGLPHWLHADSIAAAAAAI